MHTSSDSNNLQPDVPKEHVESNLQLSIQNAEKAHKCLSDESTKMTKTTEDYELFSDINGDDEGDIYADDDDDDEDKEGDDEEDEEDDDVISEQHKEEVNTNAETGKRERERGLSNCDSANERSLGRSSNKDANPTQREETNSASNSNSAKKLSRKKKKWCTVNLTACKYDCVRRSCRKFGMREVGDDEDWMLYWCDTSVSLQRVMEMKKYQKINHFPGMAEICRKDLLARNMNRMVKLFPKDYAIFPKSWCLPADYGDFQAYTRQKKNKTFILKPESGSQGKGIWICKNAKDIKPNEHAVCQQYISKPLLVDGFKFDMRLYVCVTSCDPLRIYLWRDGLARFATIKYTDPTQQNADELYMHLTNYAINKSSKEFIRDEEHGSKRRITTLYRQMAEQGVDVDKMKTDINDIIIKTLISAHPVLKHNYRTCFSNHIKGSACFEILGFDVLLDRKLRPIVLEVNHSPSFTTDSALDRELKDNIVLDTLGLLNFAASDRKRCVEEERKRVQDRLLKTKSRDSRKQEQDELLESTTQQMIKYELENCAGYYRIYPPLPDSGLTESKYSKFFEHSGTLFSETVASKARGEAARQLREDIKQKTNDSNSPAHKTSSKASAQHRSDGTVRPESPGGGSGKKGRMLQRPVSQRLMQTRKRESGRSQSVSRISNEPCHSVGVAGSAGGVAMGVDSRSAQDISEEEMVDRQSGLVQRDNLLRSMGVVDLVHKLLQSSQAPPTIAPYPVVKDKVESFREKYNLAQYGAIPFGGGSNGSQAGNTAISGSGLAGKTVAIGGKNMAVAASLPHNLAARAKLLSINKRSSSTHHYATDDMLRTTSVHPPSDNNNTGANGLLIKTNQPANQRFLFDSRGQQVGIGGAHSAATPSSHKYASNASQLTVHSGPAPGGTRGGAGLTGGDIISASFHNSTSNRPPLRSFLRPDLRSPMYPSRF